MYDDNFDFVNVYSPLLCSIFIWLVRGVLGTTPRSATADVSHLEDCGPRICREHPVLCAVYSLLELDTLLSWPWLSVHLVKNAILL